LVIALQPAALIVPFFPGRPFWWELCALLAWPSLLAYGLVNRRKIEALNLDKNERWALGALAGYVVVLVALMVYRGVGFRVFGGAQMGGRFYVQQIILAIVPALLVVASPSKKQLFFAVIAGWILSLTYLVSDFSFSAGGGAMQRILYFFEIPTDAINFELGYEQTGMRRFQSLWYAAAAGLACIWTLAPLRELFGKYALAAIPAMLALLALGLGSGHRTLLVLSVLTLIFLTLFQRVWTPMRLIAGLLILTAGTGALYGIADKLPLPVQRSISFLPGIEVLPLAKRDAVDTLNDRIGVLKMGIQDIPRYLWVGRGFGMERLDQIPRDAAHDNVYIGYLNGIFYNGTLGLLLKTGLIGFLVTAVFIIWVSRMALELVRLASARGAAGQSWFDRFSILASAQWFSLVVFFYLTHGDASLWTQTFGLPSALIIICRRHLQQDENEEVDAAVLAEQLAVGGA
jgi:hypothetical protein